MIDVYCFKIQTRSSANQSRKYNSGSQKRKRKQRIEDITQSYKETMITLKSDMPNKIDYVSIIENFISRNTRK